MKITHVSALALFALTSTAFARVDGVTLKRAFKPNTTDVYKLDQKAKMNISIAGMDIEQETTVGATITLKFADPDDKGNLNLTQTFKLDTVTATGPMANSVPDAKTLPPIVQKGTISPLNIATLEEVKMKGAVALAVGSLTRLTGVFYTFSDKAVNAGDSWDMVIPKSPMTLNKDQKFKVTYVGMKDGLVQLKVTGVLEYLVKLTPDDIEGLPGDMAIKGASTVTADVTVDPTTGQTVEATMTSKDKATMDIGGGAMTGDSNTATTVKVKLQKA